MSVYHSAYKYKPIQLGLTNTCMHMRTHTRTRARTNTHTYAKLHISLIYNLFHVYEKLSMHNV